MRTNSGRCEVCDFARKRAIQIHHIIPRYDVRSTDSPVNTVCLCSNCHNLVHACEIIVEGWFGTSAGQKFFWHKKGEPYIIRPGVILGPGLTVTIVDA